MGAFDALMEPNLFTIRRYGAGKKDAYGKATKTLLSEVRVNGLLSPASASGTSTSGTGSAEGEAFIVNMFRATIPLGTDLLATDEIVSKGKTYSVEGTPFEAVVPRTRIGVLQALLKYVGEVA